MDDAETWIRRYVEPVGPIETTHVRPWSTVRRVPLADGVAWFKACAPVQGFEPRLSAHLYRRWPDRVAEVLAHDEDRAWLLLADAGDPVGTTGNPPEAWLAALPRYAELQRGETGYADEHVAHGVPALPVAQLPDRFADLVARDLPVDRAEHDRLAAFAPGYARMCAELAADRRLGPTVQHDDLHMTNLYGRARVLDWGDASVSHPFFSLVVTFRFLEERTGLPLDDPWYARLRDAYLEPWGGDFRDTFELALRVGAVAHAIAWTRQRDFLPPAELPGFDEGFAHILRRALRVVPGH
ncbi:hypothetical protein [Actinocatenispora rupis]|uniref:hypothetical protein n=1 Tax=Actinocatenispora rupis TaxID=519421 RepID=UPI0019420962|nr:hypothetical protein [Actinocatenispora rupis]